MRYPHLFQPITIGNVELKNRIVRSAHGTLLSGEGLIAYHEARARGGVAMSTLEATSVHPSAPSVTPLHKDEVIPIYQEIAERMRPYGMKVFAQIYHPGAASRPRPGMAPLSASAIPSPNIGTVPMPMSTDLIGEMVAAFGQAARRVREGGLDGIDVHASSGYLLEQFMSPATNHRDDEYGGSFENRMRFLVEVLEEIRRVVGDDFCVGIRLPNEEYIPGGLTPQDNAQIAQYVDKYVDYVSLHMGSYWRFHKLLTTMEDPLGNEMKSNEAITSVVKKPTMVVGRIMTLDHANHIVESGAGDMVSMVRALIADPELVNKAQRGEEDQVRPCIGSNMGCVAQLLATGKLSCVVNVAAANESTVTFEPAAPAPTKKKVMIIGGGPAGLEAARTAALRGHEVVLYEATRQLGGQVSIAARAPHRSDLGAITDFLSREIERLGVKVHLGTFADPDTIAAEKPDEVIVATGGTPRRDGFQLSTPAQSIVGADLSHVYTSWDVFGFGGRAEIKGDCVIYDDTGTFEAISVADALVETGAKVTLISRHDSIGAMIPFPAATVGASKERLMSANFDFIGGHYVQGITQDEVLIGVPFTERRRSIPAGTVVLVTYNHLNREIADYVPAGVKVHMVGDVGGTNSIMAAIHQAAGVARVI
jgi:2,4-dienoyl-CoA reductase-like NADH-dependent reductase (Old Yellow Enzyme family)